MADNRLAVLYEGKPCYDIVLTEGFSELAEEFRKLSCKERKICIVTDSTVGGYYAEDMVIQLKSEAKEVFLFTFLAGEQSKTLDTVQKLYEYLILHSFDRNDILVALGGGVVGDLTGFAAATYLRGIRFVQIPTSLLSMVDSSIGGKTGVDFKAYKNMVGAFCMPKFVYINIKALNTLTQEQFYCGFGEIIKHGIIKDVSYFEWLILNRENILLKESSVLYDMIKRSCEIKRGVVEKDPKEQGERALLNFGHTIGHAVEKAKHFKILHGQCVSIGMAAASFLSCRRGYLTKEELKKVIQVLRSFSLPVCISGLQMQEVLESISHDKKKDGAGLKFILIRKIGEAFISSSVTEEEIKQAIEYLGGIHEEV